MDLVWLAAAIALFGGCWAVIGLLGSLQSEE